MGRVKQALMEAEDRGWNDPETFVCKDCVDDPFLKDIIEQNVCRNSCDYCQSRLHTNIAAPVASIMDAVAGAVSYYYCEPAQAGVPYDRGYIVEPTDTNDVLISIGLDCDDQLFEDIARSLMNEIWVPAADGHWASSHESELLTAAWSGFVQNVKHTARYFFSSLPDGGYALTGEYTPNKILPAIGHMVDRLGLVHPVADARLFRVREREGDAEWPLDAENMGAPPESKVSAGRMNPAGISYLYLAFEEETGVAEVLAEPPCKAAIARYELAEPVLVLDLTRLPPHPSIFNVDALDEREMLMFLEEFVRQTSKPVRKDGREHVEYVPSQVVSEYFALVYRNEDRVIDGILYPSAVRPGGNNLVLFPRRRGFGERFPAARFHSAREVNYHDWRDFTAALGV